MDSSFASPTSSSVAPATSSSPSVSMAPPSLSPSPSSEFSLDHSVVYEGRPFYQFLLDPSGPLSSLSIFLFYIANDGSPKGSLYWSTTEEERNFLLEKKDTDPLALQDFNNRLDLTNISDVFVGKQTQPLRHPSLADLSPDRCITLQSLMPSGTLHLYSESIGARNSLLFFIKEIFTVPSVAKHQRKMRTEALVKTSSKEIQELIQGIQLNMFYISHHSKAKKAHLKAKMKIQQTIGNSLQGPLNIGAPVHKRSILFFYAPDERSKYGHFYWMDNPGIGGTTGVAQGTNSMKKPRKHPIMLHRIVSLLVGRQSAELRTFKEKADHSHLQEGRCFSIIATAASKSIHLQAESDAKRTEILRGINELMSILARFDSDAAPEKRFKPFPLVENSMKTPEEEEKQQQETTANQPNSLNSTSFTYSNPNDQASTPTVQVPLRDYPQYDESNPFYSHATALSKGYQVSAYFLDRVEQCRFFFDLSEDELGVLYLSSKLTQREKREGNCALRVSAISDVIVGKQSAEFQTAHGKPAKGECCFSLVSNAGSSFHVEAPTEAIQAEILDHVKGLFENSALRDADKEDHSIPIAPPTQASNDMKRDYEPTNQTFGITKPDFHIRARLEKDNKKKSKSTFLESPIAQQWIKGGKTFKGYFCDLGTVVCRPVRVSFDPSIGSIGALRYKIEDNKEIPENEHYVPVVLITDAILGKSSFELRSSSTAGIPSSFCLSIVTDKSVLNVTTGEDTARKQLVEFLRELVPSISVALADEIGLVQGAAAPARVLQEKASELEEKVKTLQEQLQRSKNDQETEKAVVVAALAQAEAEKREAQKKADEAAAAVAAAAAAVPPIPLPVVALPPIPVDPLASSLSILSTGNHFLSFSLGSDVKTSRSETLFVWFEEKSGEYGTIFWSVDPQRTRQKMKKTEKQIPLQSISDVFLGKNRGELQCSLAANIGNGRCLSLVASSISRGLHLAADTGEARDSFVTALKVAFSHAHEAASSGAATELDRLCQGDEFVMTPMRLDTNPSIPSVSIPTFLFFDEETRQFYWFEEDKRDFEHQKSMMISEISDVLLGQYSASAQRELTNSSKSIVSSLCFSLISSRYQLHLQSRDEETMISWVNGISFLLSEKTEGKEKKEGATVAKQTQPENPNVTQLKKGLPLILYNYSSTNNNFTSRSLHARFEPTPDSSTSTNRYGVLHFFSPVNPADNPVQLQLDRITDIFIGKQTKSFQSPAAVDLDEGKCLSLISKSQQFDLHFESTESRLFFVESIQSIYSDQGKQVVQADQQEVEKRGKEVLSVFSSPIGLKSHTEDGDEACDVWIEGGSLYWKGKLSKSIKFIFISSMSSIIRGKNSPGAPFHAEISEKRCGIIKGSTSSFYFSADPIKRDQFVDAVEYIKAHPQIAQSVGRLGMGGGAGAIGSSSISPIILGVSPEELMQRLHDGDPALTSLDPSPCLTIIKLGGDFNRHFKVPMSQGEVGWEQITMWYQPPSQHGSKGSIMWSPVGNRIISLDRCFKFSGLTEILLGKETDAWGVPDESIEEITCFTLQIGNYQLNLEAQHKEHVNIWLYGINHILTHDIAIFPHSLEHEDTKDEKGVHDAVMGEPQVSFHVPVPVAEKRKANPSSAVNTPRGTNSELKPLDIHITNYDHVPS